MFQQTGRPSSEQVLLAHYKEGVGKQEAIEGTEEYENSKLYGMGAALLAIPATIAFGCFLFGISDIQYHESYLQRDPALGDYATLAASAGVILLEGALLYNGIKSAVRASNEVDAQYEQQYQETLRQAYGAAVADDPKTQWATATTEFGGETISFPIPVVNSIPATTAPQGLKKTADVPVDPVYKARKDVIDALKTVTANYKGELGDAARDLCTAMHELARAARKTGSDPGGQIKTVFNKAADGVNNIIRIYGSTLKSDEITANVAASFRQTAKVLREQIGNADAVPRLDLDVTMEVLQRELTQYGNVSLTGNRQPVLQVA